MEYTVYKHTSPSHKVYIGVTCQEPKQRWANGHGYYYNDHFKKAIDKYGWDNFKHEILFENLSQEEAYDIEIELIKLYDSTNPNKGYNNDKGGSGSNRGIISTEESNLKRSNAMKGRFVGKYVGEKSTRAREVNQYTKDGEFIRTWGSTTDIQRELGIGYTSIVKCCTKSQHTAGGYIWTYKEDSNSVEEIVKEIKTPKHLSESHKEHIRKSIIGIKHKSISKPIVATNIYTGEKVYYESITQTKEDGFCPQNVSKCLSQKYPSHKTCFGWSFEFCNREADKQ